MPDILFSQTALQRYESIRPFLEDGVTLTALSEMHKISGRTLQRWITYYHKRGLSGLERSKRGDKGKRRKISEEQIKIIRSYAIQKPPLLMSIIHKKMVMQAKEHGLHAPSYALVYQIVQEIDPAVLVLVQAGSKSYRQKHELVYRREASAPNELWQADHTMLDIEVLNEYGQFIRPWLTIIIDDFSRALCGYFLSLSAPNSINTALSLRQAIWRKEDTRWLVCGIPEILYVDNGSDFISEHIEQACLNLKIQLVHSMPGRPQGRGKVERMFRTINHKFLSELPGHTINGKPASSPSLNLNTLTGLFETFIHEEYHLQTHKGIGMAPLQRWKAEVFLPHLPESLHDLDILLLHVHRSRKVQRDGIKFNSLRYIDPTLVAYIGEDVEIRYDPRDLAEIQVYYQGKYICRAICQSIADKMVSLREIRQINRKQRVLVTQEIETAKNNPDNIEQKIPPPKLKQRLKLYDNE